MGGRRGGGHEEHGDSIPSNILSRKPGGGKRCPTSDCQPEIQAAGVRLNVRFGANQYQLSAKEGARADLQLPPPLPHAWPAGPGFTFRNLVRGPANQQAPRTPLHPAPAHPRGWGPKALASGCPGILCSLPSQCGSFLPLCFSSRSCRCWRRAQGVEGR